MFGSVLFGLLVRTENMNAYNLHGEVCTYNCVTELFMNSARIGTTNTIKFIKAKSRLCSGPISAVGGHRRIEEGTNAPYLLNR